ncbi:MAG: glycosyltransferase [Syntrophomonas sp.]
MEILVTTGNFENYVSPDFHYLMIELGKISNLTIWYEPGNIHEILNHLLIKPDFILINEFGETNTPKITGLSSLTIPYGIYVYDIHYQIEARKQAIAQEKVRHVFSHYRDKFYLWFHDYAAKMRWLPQHANLEVFKDYGLPKDIDYLLMGAVGERVYPLRYKIVETMKNRPNFVYHEHPGFKYFAQDDDAYVGVKYAREINRAKLFLTCDSIYQYPIAKYFEVPACKTLLLAPFSKELADLGFIPGVNFVSIDEYDFLEKAEYYLNHETERSEIAEQGYQMVRSRHSTVKRATELLAMIEEIVRNEKSYD